MAKQESENNQMANLQNNLARNAEFLAELENRMNEIVENLFGTVDKETEYESTELGSEKPDDGRLGDLERIESRQIIILENISNLLNVLERNT